MRCIRTAVLTLSVVAVAASSLEAQVVQNRFQVVVQGGWYAPASGSGLQDGGTVGGDATYYLRSSFGLGLWTDITFTETDGSLFPPAALPFVDSTTFTTINQSLNIWQFGGHAKLQLPRRVAPYALVGGGVYTLFFDPQQNAGTTTSTGFVARFGVGVDFAVSRVAGFEIAVADYFYPNWNPNELLPVRAQFQNSRFPELNPDPNALDESVHNFRFTLGVTVVPGG